MEHPDGDGQRLSVAVKGGVQLSEDAPSSDGAAGTAAPQDDHGGVERGHQGISPVSEACLATVEAELCDDDHYTPAQRSMAENVARRRADHQIITELKDRNFEGPIYEYFTAELAAYALAVLMAWMRTGEIFRKCREKGRPVPLTEIWRWDRDDRLGLAHLTVAKALTIFRDRILVPGVWDPRRGATIKTYFVGACLLQFGNFFAECTKERRKWGVPAPLDAADDAYTDPITDSPSERDPATIAIRHDRIRRAVNEMPTDLSKVAAMLYEGYTYEDAAAKIGTNAEALGARLRRFRNRQRERGSND